MSKKNIKFLNESKLELTFTKKMITSYGGFCLLAKLFEKLDFRENIEKIFPFFETSHNSTGIFSKVIKFGLTVFAGGRRFTHSVFLGDSMEVYKKMFDINRMVKSDTALTRLFNKINSFKLAELFSDKLWTYTFDKIFPFNDISADYLNFDSSVFTRYGHQEGAKKGYNSKKKGRPSHHPIFAFLNQSKYIVNLWNREGSASSGNGIVEFAKQTISRLTGRLKLLASVADTGFYKIEFINNHA